MLSLPFVTLCILWVLLPHSLGTPIASPEPEPAASPEPLTSLSEVDTTRNSYSGAGGNASGGSVNVSPQPSLLDAVTGGKSILSMSSENAGNAGDASSGPASSTRGGGRTLAGGGLSRILGPSVKIVPVGGVPNGVPLTGANFDNVALSSNSGNAYSGAGGTATGGSVSTPGSLIDLFSHNAGTGGKAKSGASRVARRQVLGKSRLEDLDDTEASTNSIEEIQPMPLRRSRAFRAI
ncbi:hypothetical protein EST38_g5863 [Candolleomyces aberdarensis]|uniref:Uncharacterized protein n=1 Tax=Candolleomyces aberdarensis TaxID=2316362 RepID=A0A4Q2DJ17_9AGAR|nr:hypothetical protein EST38_g5863 [Candolleomyces aberdarensis]